MLRRLMDAHKVYFAINSHKVVFKFTSDVIKSESVQHQLWFMQLQDVTQEKPQNSMKPYRNHSGNITT